MWRPRARAGCATGTWPIWLSGSFRALNGHTRGGAGVAVLHTSAGRTNFKGLADFEDTERQEANKRYGADKHCAIFNFHRLTSQPVRHP